jgi:copper(I)-binding protein
VAAGYLTIENKGLVSDRLLSASTEVAKRVEIHEMSIAGGIMTMHPVTDGLSIQEGQTVKFAPGGLHLMLIGLSAPLVRGNKVPVVLKFQQAGDITVLFDVEAIGASAPQHRSAPLEETTAALPSIQRPVPKLADDDFFLHLHDERAMANVTVSAVRNGVVEIAILLETVEEKPLSAQGVTVTLGNPDKGVAPVTAQAHRTAEDKWNIRMAASGAGRWNLGLGIKLAPTEIVTIEAPILIYPPPYHYLERPSHKRLAPVVLITSQFLQH